MRKLNKQIYPCILRVSYKDTIWEIFSEWKTKRVCRKNRIISLCKNTAIQSERQCRILENKKIRMVPHTDLRNIFAYEYSLTVCIKIWCGFGHNKKTCCSIKNRQICHTGSFYLFSTPDTLNIHQPRHCNYALHIQIIDTDRKISCQYEFVKSI